MSFRVLFARREGREWVNSLRREDLDALFPGVLDSIIAALRAERETEAGPCRS